MDSIKQVFVKAIKAQSEAPPKKITKSRRALPKSRKPAVKPVARTTAKAIAHRTYPMGALKGARQTRRAKLEPSGNPSKSPPFKKGTLRVLSPRGEEQKALATATKAASMTTEQKRAALAVSGHPVSTKAPNALVDQIYEGGLGAGIVG